MSPTAELHDPRRLALFEQIRKKHGREVGFKTSLLLWFGDIERLEHFATDLESHGLFAILVGFTKDIFGLYSGQYRLAAFGMSTGISFSETLVNEMSWQAVRSRTVRRDCLTRDNRTCSIQRHGGMDHTGEMGLEACHILPSWLGDVECAGTDLWSALKVYWRGERVEAWREALLGEDGIINTEQLGNLITLGDHARVYWDEHLIALKPVQRDSNTLTVELWWLPIRLTKDQLQKMIVGRKPDLVEISKSPGNNIKLFDCEIDKVIESGKVITFTTPDPARYPLPSFELLEMQWHLHRTAALSGGFNYEETEEDEEQEPENYDDSYHGDYYSDDYEYVEA